MTHKSGESLIKNVLKFPTERNMGKLANYAKTYDLTDDEIYILAKGLADSGEQINIPETESLCDIPSTGGPSSLSTLICPLYLRKMGFSILKLGVPGRPAGGIDILAQISGYKISPEKNEITEWLKKSGYVHFVANSSFVPIDASFFKFRKENGFLNIPSLVIASLLSKKIAVGLNYVGLDIRVSDFGNFGTSGDEARENGKRFKKISEIAGIQCKCFLTNGNIPQQSYIGRSEALLALHTFFEGTATSNIKRHFGVCYAMAASVKNSQRRIEISATEIKNLFFENITLQGGSVSSFYDIINKTKTGHEYTIKAVSSGIVTIDMKIIRDAIVEVQNNSLMDEGYSDPCGVILRSHTNEYVNKDDILCTVRCIDSKIEPLVEKLNKAFTIQSKFIEIPEFEEII